MSDILPRAELDALDADDVLHKPLNLLATARHYAERVYDLECAAQDLSNDLDRIAIERDEARAEAERMRVTIKTAIAWAEHDASAGRDVAARLGIEPAPISTAASARLRILRDALEDKA